MPKSEEITVSPTVEARGLDEKRSVTDPNAELKGIGEKGTFTDMKAEDSSEGNYEDHMPLDDDGHHASRPTEEEKRTLRRVAGKIPRVAYWLCLVEFAERASFYGVRPLFGNYVNRNFPKDGNGYGAPARGRGHENDKAGALGMKTVVSSAVSQSFSLLVYALPVLFGWMADAKTGRYPLICWGVAICGIAHVLMVASGAKPLLESNTAVAPFFISVYVLAVGAAMFKPNITPTLLDQMPLTVPVTKTLASGEKVIVDPEATTERIMLWFYLLINVGGFMGVPTSYTERYVGWWLSFLIPLFLYLPLPFLLWWLKNKLILMPPGGSDLQNVFRILGICFRRGGFKRLFRGGFFEPAKPSNIALSGRPMQVPWNDAFVDDVKRAFQAAGIFCFFPIQYINDNGLGEAANAQSTMLMTNGVPNDVIQNFNSLVIIIMDPVLNYGFYPLLRKMKIHYGPVARMTTGLFIATIGGAGYTIINYYAYKTGPCGNQGTTLKCSDKGNYSVVAPISVWWMAIPYTLGGFSELFINVPAYGIAYSRSPKNMRGLVSSLNLFSAAVAYAIGLACSAIIRDPFLTWDFGVPTIIGLIATFVFWYIYRDIDKEEYKLTQNEDYHLEYQEVHHVHDEESTVNRTEAQPVREDYSHIKGEEKKPNGVIA